MTENTTKRLFIAIDLPEKIKKYFFEVQSQLPTKNLKLDKNPHITLKFLGDYANNKIPRLIEELKKIAAKHKGKNHFIGLKKLGWFENNRRHIKVIWIGIKLSESLSKPQKEIEKLMNSLGFPPEQKPFYPHLTLARAITLLKPDFSKKISQIPFLQKKFHPASFSLFQSTLTSESATHKRIAEFNFPSIS